MEDGAISGGRAELFVDLRCADKRWNVGYLDVLIAGEGRAVGEFGLEIAEFGDCLVEGALVARVELRDGLEVLGHGSVFE